MGATKKRNQKKEDGKHKIAHATASAETRKRNIGEERNARKRLLFAKDKLHINWYHDECASNFNLHAIKNSDKSHGALQKYADPAWRAKTKLHPKFSRFLDNFFAKGHSLASWPRWRNLVYTASSTHHVSKNTFKILDACYLTIFWNIITDAINVLKVWTHPRSKIRISDVEKAIKISSNKFQAKPYVPQEMVLSAFNPYVSSGKAAPSKKEGKTPPLKRDVQGKPEEKPAGPSESQAS